MPEHAAMTPRQCWSALCLPLALSLALTAPAHAGRTCEARKPTVQTLTRGLELAARTHEALEAEHRRSGADVVVLARAGQDLTRYGLQWSHLGLAWRTPEGLWRVVHKLNHCGTADAALYRQGLGEFFLDDLWRLQAAWVVPAPDVQARLKALLADDARIRALHHRPYNLVSYPWSTRYQQSNQWAIETLAAALEPSVAPTGASTVEARQRAQAWLRFKGYEPTTLTLGPLTRLGGRISAANVAFDDHPNDKRFADRIETVTVDSVFAWLQRSGLAGPVQRLDGR